MNIASEAKSFVYIKEKETGFPLNEKPSGEGIQRSGTLDLYFFSPISLSWVACY